MKNREDLLRDIDELPIFELTEAYIKKDEAYLEQRQKAVIEVGGVEAVTYVSPRYQLLQFKTIFKPIVEGIEQCQGYVDSHGGFARMVLFPVIGEFDNKWGLIAMNSVDKTSSISIRFCVKYKDKSITLPSNIAGFMKPHTSRAIINVQDFIKVITTVKDQWADIAKKLDECIVTEENLKEILDNVGIQDKKFIKHVKDMIVNTSGPDYKLWELFMDLIDHISDKKYKSEIHKAKKFDKICDGIINYAILLSL